MSIKAKKSGTFEWGNQGSEYAERLRMIEYELCKAAFNSHLR